jgi:hypothetical protein
MLNKLQLQPKLLYNAELFSAAKVMTFSEITNASLNMSDGGFVDG